MKQNERFHNQLDKVSPSVKTEMDWSRAIIDRIDYILKRDGVSRKELAEIIGCRESQITRWTRGFPNYTISALAKLSIALGEPLIEIPTRQPQGFYPVQSSFQDGYSSYYHGVLSFVYQKTLYLRLGSLILHNKGVLQKTKNQKIII